MAKLFNVSLVVAFSVVCASVFTGVHGARETNYNDNSPAQAPPVDPLPKHCRIAGSCGDFLSKLIVTKTLPSEKDVVCCREIVQTTKYCWETIMNILEDPTIPAFAHLHPWADNAWDKCVSVANSPAQAASVEVPSFPEQCRISEACGETWWYFLGSKTLPGENDVMCCQDIIQNTKDCWEKAMSFIEDPKIPMFADLHPWAENAWSKCVSLTADSPAQAPVMSDSPAQAQAPLMGDSPAQAPLMGDSPTQAPTLPEQCRISGSCANTLAQLIVSKTMPSSKDISCCQEIVEATKDCWDKTMDMVEDPNVPALAHLHPWADLAWSQCVRLSLTNQLG